MIMETKRKKCRIWWPTHLSSILKPHSHSFTFFFGWSIFSNSSSEPSLDIVVAFALNDSELASLNLQGILQQTNGIMPLSLRDKCTFSLLGYCSADFGGNDIGASSERDKHTDSTNYHMYFHGTEDSCVGKNDRLECGCYKVDGFLKHFRLASIQNDSWVQLVCISSMSRDRKMQVIPELHHIHWNGETVSKLDLHVIIYEIPKFGLHHYSLGSRSISNQMRSPTKKPKWVEDLQQKQPCIDLDAVILAINCVNSAKICSERHLPGKGFVVPFNLLQMITIFPWKLVAVFLASFSTFLYIILQCVHFFLSFLSHFCIYTTLANLFCNTWRIIEIHCCQFLYWPIFLQNCGLRSLSCVEYAEQVALRRHSMWSSLVVDAFLGNLFGIALWSQSKSACLWVSNFFNDITNYLLRSGCVWLMGNPAGFKLNTELAGVLGMMSLDVIQIWSTLWSFMGFLFIPIFKMIALSGILFGFSAAAALIIDMISLLTKHVFILHWLLSVLYSQQIHALAALWRFFRGKKWNPLRQRLDSYDYTVEQHVVGSLLFTPLLLLLPTTSAFYTFFTIMNSAVSFICVVVKVSIYVIHATPYNKIFLWLIKKRRFPAGIWFEFICHQQNADGSAAIGALDLVGSSPRESRKSRKISSSRSTVLVSFLHSNYLNSGELVQSNYDYVQLATSRSCLASSAYGVLTGKRFPSALGTIPLSRLPWMAIPCKDYWSLCYEAIFGCREN